MTREKLNQYKNLQNEIATLESRIDKLLDKDIDVVCGTVKASMKSFPYTEYRPLVLIEEPKSAGERDKLIRMYKERISKAREVSVLIENFIGKIDDSITRQIFQFVYIDGIGVTKAAERLNYSKGRVSQIISKYLKD